VAKGTQRRAGERYLQTFGARLKAQGVRIGAGFFMVKGSDAHQGWKCGAFFAIRRKLLE